MATLTSLQADQLLPLVGSVLGVSDWFSLSQSRIDAFALATDDHQFIHVDPQRAARESPFGGTIAHGFFTLALLPAMARQALPEIEDVRMRINYGFDKLRFLAPVPSGSRVRGRFTLLAAEERRPKELTLKYEVTVEIENATKPALIAEWLSRLMLKENH